jgi:hypothetical protein
MTPPAHTPDVPADPDRIRGWLTGRLPSSWYEAPVDVVVDRDEIVIRGTLPAPEVAGSASDAEREAAAAGRIKAFREDTRDERIVIARELEHTYRRKVAWAVVCGERAQTFTALAAPVMTRLRQPERLTLDTLVAAGVARSRADALAWCVRLVGQHEGDWLSELTQALEQVEALRAKGPTTR